MLQLTTVDRVSLFSYYLTKINREGLAVLARGVQGFLVSFKLKLQTGRAQVDSIYQSAALLPPAAASLLLSELLM